jgi:hypothetical protein
LLFVDCEIVPDDIIIKITDEVGLENGEKPLAKTTAVYYCLDGDSQTRNINKWRYHFQCKSHYESSKPSYIPKAIGVAARRQRNSAP